MIDWMRVSSSEPSSPEVILYPCLYLRQCSDPPVRAVSGSLNSKGIVSSNLGEQITVLKGYMNLGWFIQTQMGFVFTFLSDGLYLQDYFLCLSPLWRIHLIPFDRLWVVFWWRLFIEVSMLETSFLGMRRVCCKLTNPDTRS